MLAYHHFVVATQNDNAGGAANYNLVDFDFAVGSPSVPFLASRIIGYVGGYLASYGAAGSSIASISYRLSTIAGSVDVPFPTTAYAGLRDTFPGLPDYTGYGEALGDGGLTPIGTSIQVREFTANVTRSGKGRHYLPFVGADFITASGQVNATAATEISNNYGILFLGQVDGGDSVIAVDPIVYSRKFDLVQPVLSVSTSQTCSNLRTRRR